MSNSAFCLFKRTRISLTVAASFALGLLSASNLSAWDAYVSVDDLESSFYVDFFSGTHTWTTLGEGINADSGTGTSLPNNLITQTWDGSAWPSDAIYDDETVFGVTAESSIEHYDGVEDEFFDYAEIYVYGDIPADTSFGGSWYYDFELVLDPFSTANVYLDPLSANAGILSEVGDEGNAFASIRLHSTDVDLNDPGGANDPYDVDSLFLAAPPTGDELNSQFELSHEFNNTGASPITYNLRLRASVSIFESPSSEELAGDYNEDGTVDAADYTVWRDSVGSIAGTLPNDIDGGIIGMAQYSTWVSNYGMSNPLSSEVSSIAVPEPTALLLATIAIGFSCKQHVTD